MAFGRKLNGAKVMLLGYYNLPLFVSYTDKYKHRVISIGFGSYGKNDSLPNTRHGG